MEVITHLKTSLGYGWCCKTLWCSSSNMNNHLWGCSARSVFYQPRMILFWGHASATSKNTTTCLHNYIMSNSPRPLVDFAVMQASECYPSLACWASESFLGTFVRKLIMLIRISWACENDFWASMSWSWLQQRASWKIQFLWTLKPLTQRINYT